MQPTRSGIVGSVRDLHQFMAFKGISSQNFICFFGDSTQGCKDCNILGFHCVKSMSGNPESSPFWTPRYSKKIDSKHFSASISAPTDLGVSAKKQPQSGLKSSFPWKPCVFHPEWYPVNHGWQYSQLVLTYWIQYFLLIQTHVHTRRRTTKELIATPKISCVISMPLVCHNVCGPPQCPK